MAQWNLQWRAGSLKRSETVASLGCLKEAAKETIADPAALRRKRIPNPGRHRPITVNSGLDRSARSTTATLR